MTAVTISKWTAVNISKWAAVNISKACCYPFLNMKALSVECHRRMWRHKHLHHPALPPQLREHCLLRQRHAMTKFRASAVMLRVKVTVGSPAGLRVRLGIGLQVMEVSCVLAVRNFLLAKCCVDFIWEDRHLQRPHKDPENELNRLWLKLRPQKAKEAVICI